MALETDSVYVKDPIIDPKQLVTKEYVDKLLKQQQQTTIVKKEVVIVDKHTQTILDAIKNRNSRNTNQINNCASGWSESKCNFHY